MTDAADAPIRVMCVYGTRPEAIKMAPVIAELRARPATFDTVVVTTAQHRAMVDQMAATFPLAPDRDLDLMRPSQTLNDLTARTFAAIDTVLTEVAPDWVLVQGDTTTAAAVAVACFNRRVRVGHVEAGLRTGDMTRPFPEEGNRRLIDVVADAMFAPTVAARDALLAEGHDAGRISLTGNTIVDALAQIAATIGAQQRQDQVLVTVHRRESFGDPIRQIFAAVRTLAERFPQTRWIFPVHPNPQAAAPAHAALQGVPNVVLCEPLPYPDLIRQLGEVRLVLTDSGGIQEEAPSFGTPVLVLRDVTERPEGVAAGVAELVGSDPERIIAAATRHLSQPLEALAGARVNPFGDGQAARRIVAVLAGEPTDEFVPPTAPLSPNGRGREAAGPDRAPTPGTRG